MSNINQEVIRTYDIYIAEYLSLNWRQIFPEVVIREVASGTCITVQCRDQSELHGIIRIISKLGLTLQTIIMQGFLDDSFKEKSAGMRSQTDETTHV
ncbi:hypothetical protein OA92_16455 [Marinomonas sp. SBI22]|jgi:hypothetical protein|uniref:hypothetical protein n=1 Tax=unclassified Marinomonas TaxID=196814 RepID=UPI0005F9E1BE|nr:MULTISPECIES: hypothetical protein [unclassified Marinomonas]KJZ15633.1 hypothetical protein TW85_01640 [Marinomonas sp. S3726]KZM40609.1 hypothetical protein OA92_16455 [Marinomonas sp. SBI22]KZM42311.1 hypothetical protein OA91_14655 [Marinomonas sp. SBI8L]